MSEINEKVERLHKEKENFDNKTQKTNENIKIKNRKKLSESWKQRTKCTQLKKYSKK